MTCCHVHSNTHLDFQLCVSAVKSWLSYYEIMSSTLELLQAKELANVQEIQSSKWLLTHWLVVM